MNQELGETPSPLFEVLEGGRVSDRQWSDVLGVLKAQGDRLDREYLASWAGELEIRDLLDRALAEA